MAASPHLLSNIEASSYDARSPSPPLIRQPLNWKTPSIRERKRAVSPLLDSSTDDVLTTPLTWKRPALASRINQLEAGESSTDTEVGDGEVLPYTKTHPRLSVIEQENPSSSSSSTLDVEDGNYELESILIDEEEFSIPAYNRHRSRTGIEALDEYLATESNELVEEEREALGLASGSALEVIGPPASGKTTLLIQIAVLERLHSLQRCQNVLRRGTSAEGDEWEDANEGATQVMLIGMFVNSLGTLMESQTDLSSYIADTEGSIGLDCVAKVASDCIHQSAFRLSMTSRLRLLRILLSGIHYCRCASDYELLALLRTLLPVDRRKVSSQLTSSQSTFKENKHAPSGTFPIRTSMVIIDSISYLLRAPLPDDGRLFARQRSRLIEEIRLFCARCSSRGIKVIFSNQMKMVIVDKYGNQTDMNNKEGEGHFIPLIQHMNGSSILGNHVWRLMLFRDGRQQCNSNDGSHFAHIIGRPARIAGSVNQKGEMIDWTTWIPIAIQYGLIRHC